MDDFLTIFTAHRVAVELMPDLNAKIVAVGESEDDQSGECLLFQRALTFTPQDHELGMATYAVTDRWGATAYGCLEHYEITTDSLRLQFNDEGAKALGLPRSVRVGLAFSREDIDTLRVGLQEVLAEVDGT